MEMKSFNKTNPKKKVIILSTIVIGITISLVCISFAFYQKESEITLVNSSVRKLDASEVSYETDENDEVKTVEDAINDLKKRAGVVDED